MKKVMRNKKVITMMVVGLVAIFLAVGGVVASPPMGAGDSPVESKINYQGQLTDSAGNPLTGVYDMEFRFYNSAIDGSQVGITITKNDVTVTNGLFSVKLDVHQHSFNGQGLWLEVRIGGEALSPRQEILPVPYALSLKPGARISGASTDAHLVYICDSDTQKTYDAFFVDGQTTLQATGQCPLIVISDTEAIRTLGDLDIYDGDLYVEGYVNYDGALTGPAVEIGGSGNDGYISVKNAADETTFDVSGDTGRIESGADSYIFVPGNEFIKSMDTDTTRWGCWTNGAVRIWRGAAAGGKTIYIPITVPGVLYGQEVTVEELTIYYVCQNGTKNYISYTGLVKQVNASSSVLIGGDDTDRTSNTATSYTLSLTQHNVLSSDYGILGLRLWLNFVDDTNYIVIGGVRLRLSHD
jgi:hypothetical protein